MGEGEAMRTEPVKTNCCECCGAPTPVGVTCCGCCSKR